MIKNIASPPDFKKLKSPTSPKNAQLNPIRLERPKSFSNEVNNEMGVKQKKMKKIIKKFFLKGDGFRGFFKWFRRKCEGGFED